MTVINEDYNLEKLVNRIVDLIKKDPKEYANILNSDWDLPNNVLLVFEPLDYKIYKPKGWPSIEVNINLGEFRKGDFFIKYKYEIHFSKLSSEYYKSEFRYTISNLDPDSSGQIEEVTWDGQTNTNYKFELSIKELLKNVGYNKLDQLVLSENIYTEIGNLKPINKSHISVDDLLFEDFLGVGDDPYTL